MSGAFDTPTGFPRSHTAISAQGLYAPERVTGMAASKAYLADIGTMQVEFRYLSKHVNDGKYAEKVRRTVKSSTRSMVVHRRWRWCTM